MVPSWLAAEAHNEWSRMDAYYRPFVTLADQGYVPTIDPQAMPPAMIGATMNCPNCATTFVYRADYATHLQQCRPDTATRALLARLNAAAVRLHAEFGEVERPVTRQLHPAA
jgi:hypothetical protein